MSRSHYPIARPIKWSMLIAVPLTFLALYLLAGALPASAAPPLGCENWGAPSFYCPPNGPVCGSSPNYYCPTGTPTACPAYNKADCASCTCVPDWATACSPPVNGFRDGTGTCACKPGTTLCAATNTCITNLSCASGQVFDACSNSCVEKYVLNSPASAQSGSINITGGAVVGSFKLTATPSNGYILTSDSQGNASWSAPTTGLGGSGTLNYIAKFTPNGTSLGNSGLVDDGSKVTLTNETLLLTGTTGTTPASGAGTRLMWIPSKSAFRAGAATASQLDDGNIGNYSFAVGQDNAAAGTHSNAMGWNNTINATNGAYATAFGRSNNIGSTSSSSYGFASGYSNSVNASYATALGRSGSATGSYSLTAGYANTASGSASRAMGYYATAAGGYATAMGYYTSAAGYNAFAAGYYASAAGDYGIALGPTSSAVNNSSIAIGGYTTAGSSTKSSNTAIGGAISAIGQKNMVLGYGVSSTSRLENTTDNSLMIGFNSTSPALTVTGGGSSSSITASGIVVAPTYAPSYGTWEGYSHGSGGAAIVNDNVNYKKLMIVGNNSAGGSREVGIWDNLTVNGSEYLSGNLSITNGSPTVYFVDNDHRSAMTHVNSNIFYVLRGCGIGSGSWCSTKGYWPFTINLEDNNATLGGDLRIPVGRLGLGSDWNTGGALSLYPSDGYAWFHIDNGWNTPYPARTTGSMRFSYGINPGDNVIMSMTQGKTVTFEGNIVATNNTRNSCTWEGSYDISSSGTWKATTCPDGKYMAGIEFRTGGENDELDMWSLYCCEL